MARFTLAEQSHELMSRLACVVHHWRKEYEIVVVVSRARLLDNAHTLGATARSGSGTKFNFLDNAITVRAAAAGVRAYEKPYISLDMEESPRSSERRSLLRVV